MLTNPGAEGQKLARMLANPDVVPVAANVVAEIIIDAPAAVEAPKPKRKPKAKAPAAAQEQRPVAAPERPASRRKRAA